MLNRKSFKSRISGSFLFQNNKLKISDDTVSPSKTTTTLYLASSVYEDDVLQFIGMEEGRIRRRTSDGHFRCDYMLKDHLGNVRALITEESRTDSYPAATMETATATTEEALYSNLPDTRTDAPVGYGGGTPQKVAVVKSASGYQKVGPSLLLKVMAGDKFDVSVNSYWSDASSPNAPDNIVTDSVVRSLLSNLQRLWLVFRLTIGRRPSGLYLRVVTNGTLRKSISANCIYY